MNDWQNFLGKIETEFGDGSKNWLRKPTIKKTVHPNNGGKNIHKTVKEHEYFSLAADPNIGGPDKRFGTHSKTAVQSVYHITKLQKHFNINPNQLETVTDIGAGYGHMCYTFRQCGFVGEYNLIDFEIMHKMQSYFLNNTGFVGTFRSLDQLNKIEKKQNSLLFGSYSINEMPLSSRKKIEPFYSDYKYIMIVYKNNSAFGVDNVKYFNDLLENLKLSHNAKIINDELCKNDLILLASKK